MNAVKRMSEEENYRSLKWMKKDPEITLGVIYLVHLQDFPKNQHFLPPDTYTYVCVSGGKKC